MVELVPEWFGSPQGQRTRGSVVKVLDPERRYRELDASPAPAARKPRSAGRKKALEPTGA